MNALYAKAREAFLTGSINWVSDTIKVALVRPIYVPNLATDQWFSTVVSSIIGTPQTLAGKTATYGVADADDVVFHAVTTGYAINYLVIYKDTGDPSTSPLIVLLDTATGLSFTTSGRDVVVTFSNTTSRIFAL